MFLLIATQASIKIASCPPFGHDVAMKNSVILLWAVVFVPFVAHARDGIGNWFERGERLTYEISWLGLSAGGAEILYEALPAKGEPYPPYLLVARAWTGDGVSNLFRLRDRLSVFGYHKTADMVFLAETFTLELNENEYRADKQVRFDRGNGQAVYENRHAGEEPRGYAAHRVARDSLSALYALRAKVKGASVGDVLELPVFDLNRQFWLKLHVRGKEVLDTPFGKLDTLHVQPVLEEIGGDERKDNWHIWVTDDENYLPVMIKVELKFGSFKAKLVDVGGPGSVSKAPEELPAKGPVHLGERKLNHANPVPE